MRISRRNLLAGFVGASAIVGRTGHGHTVEPLPRETRAIPKTGEPVPVIGLGSWITFNVGSDPVLLQQCVKVIFAFAEEGGGVIDSSPMYGSSQATIGRGLAALGDRTAIFSADKVWTSSPVGGPEQIDQTRREWGISSFDLLQVHNLVAWKKHLETLQEMKASGRLRYVGVTTSHGRRHDVLERIMRDEPIDFVQLTYNILDREPERRLFPLAKERGIGVIVNRPYRRGALLNRYRDAPLPGWAAEIGATSWAQVLLKYVISHPTVTVAIPATRRVAHLRENKAAARGSLPDEAMRRRMAADIAQI